MIVASLGVKTGESPPMEKHANISLEDQFAATLDWWRGAGVDFEFSDTVEPMLSEEKPRQQQAAPAKQEPELEAPPEPKVKASDLPDSLQGFREWWVSPENPFVPRQSIRVAPIGVEGAPIMVLAAMPEEGDKDTLFSGSQGRMMVNMLRALGIDPNSAYLACALPAYTTLPDWDDLGREGLGTAIVHHIALAKPSKVLILGSKLPALLGHDQAAAPESFGQIGNSPALTSFSPDRLLDHARQRARLWKRLCQWMATA